MIRCCGNAHAELAERLTWLQMPTAVERTAVGNSSAVYREMTDWDAAQWQQEKVAGQVFVNTAKYQILCTYCTACSRGS